MFKFANKDKLAKEDISTIELTLMKNYEDLKKYLAINTKLIGLSL